MSRIREKQVTLKEEFISPNTMLSWDPQTGNGFIEWNVEKITYQDNEYVGRESVNMFQTQFRDILTRSFVVNDPVRGAPVTISGAGVMSVVKILFGMEWNKFEAELEKDNAVVPPQEQDTSNLAPES